MEKSDVPGEERRPSVTAAARGKPGRPLLHKTGVVVAAAAIPVFVSIFAPRFLGANVISNIPAALGRGRYCRGRRDHADGGQGDGWPRYTSSTGC